MFFSEQFLSRRGPLGNIWLAAHWERRLTKGQLLKTDVGKSVEAIMGQQTAPLALRLTGQLLLGVVRIYSRKAKYLLDDCNDALLKIKVAFRSGAGDVTTEALNVPRNTITLATALTDFDMGAGEAALDNWELPNETSGVGSRATPARQGSVPRRRGPESGSSHLARAQDITLPRLHDDGGFDDAAYMTEGGIASGDFDDAGELDLGLLGDDAPMPGFGDEGALDDSMSIGVGRDAAGSDIGGRSVGSMLGLKDNVPRADSLGPMPDYDDGGFDDFDLGLDDAPIPPPMSVTSDVAPGAEDSIDMTPRTAAKIREAAERRALEEGKTVGGVKGRRQIIDAEIQLAGKAPSQGVLRKAPEGTLTAQEYLPSSRAYLRLLGMQTESNKLGLDTELYAGPIGLASELSSLFTFDAASLRRRRIDEATEGERAAKRARREGSDEYGSEVGRRAAFGFDDPSMGGLGAGFDNTFGDDEGVDFAMMDDGMPDDVHAAMLGDEDDAALRRSARKSRGGPAPTGLDAFEDDEEAEGRLEPLTRLSTPEANLEPMDDALNFSPSSSQPLAVFDARPSDAEAASTSAAASKSGWSNNTVRALRVVRSQLAPADEADDAAEEEEPKQLSFQSVALNASRRAAAGFFFELLVLGTKDCIKIEQPEAYADIQVSAKPALWTVAGGVAPQQQEA